MEDLLEQLEEALSHLATITQANVEIAGVLIKAIKYIEEENKANDKKHS